MGEGSGGVTKGVWMEWRWEKGGLSGWVAVGMRWDEVGEAVASWDGVASLRRSGTVGVGWDGREGVGKVLFMIVVDLCVDLCVDCCEDCCVAFCVDLRVDCCVEFSVDLFRFLHDLLWCASPWAPHKIRLHPGHPGV